MWNLWVLLEAAEGAVIAPLDKVLVNEKGAWVYVPGGTYYCPLAEVVGPDASPLAVGKIIRDTLNLRQRVVPLPGRWKKVGGGLGD